MLIPIINMMIDMANSKAFTVVPVKVKNYYKQKKPFYYEVLSEFHYFANVEWKGEMFL